MLCGCKRTCGLVAKRHVLWLQREVWFSGLEKSGLVTSGLVEKRVVVWWLGGRWLGS